MNWNELFDNNHEPTDKQIKKFVGTPLWEDLAQYLQKTYNVRPKLFYSGCSMDAGVWQGWNVKYKKSGKALCTLYPKQGYFVASIAIGAKEQSEADILIRVCDKYTKKLYEQTKSGYFGKSLAIEVTGKNILNDVKNFIALRAEKK